MMTHEYPTLNAALGYAAASGRMAATAVHVDVGTQHYGAAIHTARHSGLPVLITAGAPPVAYPGSMRGARDGSHFWVQQTADQAGIVRQYMKWDHRLEYQDNPGLIVSRAVQIARSEPRGPVYLTLPREIAFLPADGARFPTAQQLGIARAPAPTRTAARVRRTPRQGAQSGDRGAALRPQPCDRAGAGAARRIPRRAGLRGGARTTNASRWPSALSEHHARPVPGRRGAGDRGGCAVDPRPPPPPRDAYVAVIDIDPIKAHIGTYEFAADMRLIADTEITLGCSEQSVEVAGGPVTARASRAAPPAGPTSRVARFKDRERRARRHRRRHRRSRRSGSPIRSARRSTRTA